MINSILYGPGILEKVGKKMDFKKDCAEKQENRIKIGKKDSRSITTFPEKADDFLEIKGGMIFIDLAGILDSRGLKDGKTNKYDEEIRKYQNHHCEC